MSESENADIGSRVQLIIDVLAQALDRAVMLDDDDLKQITCSRQIGELDDVRMYSLLQRVTEPTVKAELYALGIGTATEAIWTPALPQHGLMTRFCVPVCSANARFGYLWVLDPEHSLSEQGQQLARQAGRDLVAVLDRRNAALRAAESANQALIGRLLSCDGQEPFEQLLPDLQERDIAQPDSAVSVFAFEPESGGPPGPVQRTIALRLRLATTEPSHKWFTLAGKPTAIVAISGSHDLPDPEQLSDAVQRAVEHTYRERPAIGWSGDRSPISEAAQAFQHARLAMNLAQIGASTAAVTRWSELGSWQTLALLADSYSSSPEELARLVHPGVVGLLGNGRGDLVHTLHVYLAHGGDVRKTADALHLHRSTLYYRLEKIAEAVGGDLSDGEARFELMLSIRLAYFAGLYRHSHGHWTDI
jgi:PucR C-terminal helix-turn-helix domain